MWNEFKELPRVWKLVAIIGVPATATFACVMGILLGHLIITGQSNPVQSSPQEIVQDSPPPTALPSPESPVDLSDATSMPPETSYELNWKIEENQPIAYDVVMETSCCNSVDYGEVFNFGQSDRNKDEPSPFESMVEEFRDNQPTYSLASILEKKPNGNISVEILLDNVEMPEQDASQQQWYGSMIQGMEGRVQLQGELTPEGEIASTYMAQQQKNLLALFFELPVKPAKVGDSWQIDLTCITLNSAQFKIENSERVNQVTLTEISKTPQGQTVAVLDYSIAEFVQGDQNIPFFSDEPIPTTMDCRFLGQGEFLIEEGRWQSFSVENTVQSTGMVTSNVTRLFELVPLDELPEYSEPTPQERPSISEILSRTENLKTCLYKGQDIIGENTQGERAFGSYQIAGGSWQDSEYIVLHLANMKLPEEVMLNGEKFVRNPFEKRASEQQPPIPISPSSASEPTMMLVLTSDKEVSKDTIEIEFDGQIYPLEFDDSEVVNQGCQ